MRARIEVERRSSTWSDTDQDAPLVGVDEPQEQPVEQRPGVRIELANRVGSSDRRRPMAANSARKGCRAATKRAAAVVSVVPPIASRPA